MTPQWRWQSVFCTFVEVSIHRGPRRQICVDKNCKQNSVFTVKNQGRTSLKSGWNHGLCSDRSFVFIPLKQPITMTCLTARLHLKSETRKGNADGAGHTKNTMVTGAQGLPWWLIVGLMWTGRHSWYSYYLCCTDPLSKRLILSSWHFLWQLIQAWGHVQSLCVTCKVFLPHILPKTCWTCNTKVIL